MDEETYIDPETGEELTADYTQSLSPGKWWLPTEERKNTAIEVIHRAIDAPDSTKTSFMNDIELVADRAFLRGIAYADFMYGKKSKISGYLKRKAEIIAAPTLGRGGNLINAAITTKKEFRARLKEPQKGGGWFKKKKPEEIET